MKKIGKILTIAISSVALTASAASILVMCLNDANVVDLSTDEIRYYQGSFYSEGSLYYETPELKRGDLIGLPSLPTKDTDSNGDIWTFIGWDIDNNNIPDIIGERIYFNFEAHAIFMKVPIPDEFSLTNEQMDALLNIIENLNIQLSPEQIERLVEILQGLNIDWSSIDEDLLARVLDFLGMDLEDLMQMLDMDLEDLLALLNAPVFEFTSSDYTLPAFFRTTNYKDYTGDKWTNSDYYSKDNISEESINPLCFAADKISQAVAPATYDITYLKSGKKYPVPAYELYNNQDLNSESYSLTSPEKAPREDYPKASTYSTSGIGFYPASGYTVPLLLEYEYSSKAIEEDEIKYREYVKDTYLNVKPVYKEFFLELAEELEIKVDDTFTYIAKINEYFKEFEMFDLTTTEMKAFPEDEDDIFYFMEESKSGLSNHFANATTLFYRSLGIPARYVEGYFTYPAQMGEPPIVVGGLFAHSWVEIYIDDVGWMMIDTSVVNAIPDELSEFLFGAPGVVINDFEDRELSHIEATLPYEQRFVGQKFDKKDLKITAHYTNGTTCNIPYTLEENKENPLQSLTIFNQDFETVGSKVVKVLYVERGIPATYVINIEVVEPVIYKIEVVPSSYQQTYLPGNDLNIADMKFIATLTDESTETLDLADVGTQDIISTNDVGIFNINFYLIENPEITCLVPIRVIEEPEAELISIYNNRTTPYQVVKETSLKPEKLEITARYADKTYRSIGPSTGTFDIEGDFTEVGVTTATIKYTERNVSKTIIVTVQVIPHEEDLIFEITTNKVYDGQPFNLNEIVRSVNSEGEPLNFLRSDEHIEVIVYSSRVAVEDFIDVAKTTFFLKLRIIDDKGNISTDDYFGATNTIALKDTQKDTIENWQIGSEGFEMDEEGYIDLDAFDFKIDQREIYIETSNITYNSESDTYFMVLPEVGLSPIARQDSISLPDENKQLLPNDRILYENLVYSTLSEGLTSIENSFDLNTLTIYDDLRMIEVTNNYKIVHEWGTLERA